RRYSPTVDIAGEEESDRTDSPWQIVTDPIDGTYPYIWGMPVSTFMMGLLYEGIPMMGVIYDPFIGRLFLGRKDLWACVKTGSLCLRLKVSDVLPTQQPVVGFAQWPGCPYDVSKVYLGLIEKGFAT